MSDADTIRREAKIRDCITAGRKMARCHILAPEALLGLDALVAENQQLRDAEDRFRRVLGDAERALADAAKIIESRTGRGSWVGSLILARVTAALDGTDDGPPRAENRDAVKTTGEKGTF